MLSFKKSLIFFSLILFFLAPISIEKNESVDVDTISPNQSITIVILTAHAVEVVDGLLACKKDDFTGLPKDIPCELTNFIQWIVVNGGNVIVGLAAFFMDTFLFHSLQSGSYRDSGFIVQGWEILRDFTNIVFIFALLMMAFNLVLGRDESNTKGRLVKTILIALVINFSLFVTYAIIDASNILAYTFYNKIEQNEVTFNTESGNELEAFKGKSVSLAIAKKINPQQILNDTGVSNPTVGQRIVMVLMAGVINGVLIYVFLSVTFLFLGRTIGLWLSAVLAPLAFASLTVPAMQKMKYIGFGKWFSSLLQMAFMAPVFLFFLYLAVQFMKIDIVGTGAGAGSGAFINNNA